jgi:ubiquitin carboxyl-terminal hydrolase 25/28
MDAYLSNYARTLGVTRHDSISTILAAYEQQKACDTENLPKYLGALDALSKALPRAEELSYKLAFERSMGYYTDGQSTLCGTSAGLGVLTCIADVEKAYARIGYTSDYAQVICVEPDEAPDDEILKMHREATQRALNQEERQEIASALVTIGRHRKNAMMVRFGESGQSLMTVDEAYAALSAPKDSIDDGLIM